MKKIYRYLLVMFLFAGLFLFSKNIKIFAKVSTSPVFEVEVGNEKLPLFYNLVNSQIVYSGTEEVGNFETGIISMKNGETYIVNEKKVLDEENNEVGSINENILNINSSSYTLGEVGVREKILFQVSLRGISETKKSYRWEHTFCYKIGGLNEICETDFTGKDQGEDAQEIFSNATYNFSFWDGHMPYYSEDLIFEYVKFSNRFVNLIDASEVIVLNDIEFNSLNNEISYLYNYDVVLSEYESNGQFYVGASNISATLVNNTSSSLNLNGSPEYKFINEVCVESDNCDVFETDTVYSNNRPLKITPYLGNINFSYNNSYFANKNNNYENITFKTSLKCIANCSSRRIEEETIVVFEKNYEFDYKGPFTDSGNTVIFSVEEYVKSVSIKITVMDEGVGVNDKSLIYRLGWNNNGSCSFTNEIFYYENGVDFDLGSTLKDGAICMYYTASDNLGNQMISDYYYFYFDNNAPIVSTNSGEYNNGYYSEVVLNINVVDNYSGTSTSYYLWSEEELDESEYLLVKERGEIYENVGELSSIDNVSSDGAYYLYFLAYDNLENYKFYDIGNFNFDVTSLKGEEVNVTISNMDNYSNGATFKINVSEMEEETFKCGFFYEGEVVEIDDLTYVCSNGIESKAPSNLEGKYSLWIYAHDKANNYSLLEVAKDLFIDTAGPLISYDILKADDNYHITNSITLNVKDLNEININTLKYGWFISNKTNVKSNDLRTAFIDGEKVAYPHGYYGEYKLYVKAEDVFGNESFICLNKVFKIDTDVIRISLIGEKTITIIRGQDYIDLGAKAYKGNVSSGGRISDISVSGEVNSRKPGTYYVTYSSGEGELLVSVTRKVVVKNDVPYIVVVGVLFILGTFIISGRLFIRRRNIK